MTSARMAKIAKSRKPTPANRHSALISRLITIFSRSNIRMISTAIRRGRTLVPCIDMNMCKKSINGVIFNPSIKKSGNTMVVQGIQDLLWRNEIDPRSVSYSRIETRDYG